LSVNFYTLNCRGTLLSLQKPQIMGILNLTPDSFSDGGKFNSIDDALRQSESLIKDGATIIDIGGYSSRPGADDISLSEELKRVLPVTEQIRKTFPETILSTDTFRSQVATEMLALGVHIVNDISAGLADPLMMATAARHSAPMILMHMQGTPQTMQENPAYENPTAEVLGFLSERVKEARINGVEDLIIDPGFGFGKTLAHNYEILGNLPNFRVLGVPILVGISRKSMVSRVAGTDLAAQRKVAFALHVQALLSGASILRVHEPAEARKAIELFNLLAHGVI
jgi:dihydropteroate synthase